MTIILLNELEDTVHNAAFKIFASRRKQKRRAFESIHRNTPAWLNLDYEMLVYGLFRIWFDEEDYLMTPELTKEKVMEMGKLFGRRYLELLPVKDRLKGVPVRDRLEGVSFKDRLEDIPIEEIEEIEVFLRKRREEENKKQS